MSWLSDFTCDLARNSQGGAKGALKALLLEPGVWALLQYRVEAAVYRSAMPPLLKAPLRAMLTASHKGIEVLTGVSLPCTTQIGPGLHLPHCGFRIAHSAAVIGANCCISQGVTIGISGRGQWRGVPVIGDRGDIGANAVVVGLGRALAESALLDKQAVAPGARRQWCSSPA
jgi:serine O-acetyltransferase